MLTTLSWQPEILEQIIESWAISSRVPVQPSSVAHWFVVFLAVL